MASLDFAAKFKPAFALASAVSTATNSAAIDTEGFDGVSVVTSVTASAGVVNVEFLESDDDDVGNATAVERVVFNPAIEATGVIWASPVPAKRYLFARYVPVSSGTATVHTIAILGHARFEPTYSN